MNAIVKEDEAIGKQALEFWITLSEKELSILEEIEETGAEIKNYEFVQKAMQNVMPVILESLTKQDEDPENEEATIATQAGTLLRSISNLVKEKILPLVFPFINKFINDNDWRKWEAATFAFGAILEGPDTSHLTQLISQAFPLLMKHMKDKEQLVKDTAAWTIATICEIHPILAKSQLQNLMHVLVDSLNEPPKVASQVCFALHNLAQTFFNESENQSSPISYYFQPVITKLLEMTKRFFFNFKFL